MASSLVYSLFLLALCERCSCCTGLTRWQSAGRSGAQLPPPFNVYGKASVVDAQQRLRNVAAAAGLSMEEAALRWLTHHSELGAGDGIILGASRAGQVTATTAAIARGPLPSSVAEKLKELWVSVEKDVSSITSFE